MQDIYIHDYVNGFGFFQGILLCMVIFFYPGGNRSSNKYLALHLLCITLILAAPFSQKMFRPLSDRADRFVEPFQLLIYPFLYFYIAGFSEKIAPAAMRLHLLPFLLYTPLVAASLVYQPELARWNLATFGFDFTLLVFVSLKVVLFGVYLYLCRLKISALQERIKENFSDISRINLNWANQLIFMGIGVIAIYFGVMMFIVANPSLARLNFLLVGLLTAYIYFASFKGLTQPSIFRNAAEPAAPPSEETERRKYERSALPDTRQEALVNQLKELMVKDKLFLEPELTIQTLGEKLKVSPYYISQVLNQKLKSSFYDFINQYRVEEAKRLLSTASHDHFTMLAIAFESGFNSKTTFNTVFKKFTDQTPSAFKSNLAV